MESKHDHIVKNNSGIRGMMVRKSMRRCCNATLKASGVAVTAVVLHGSGVYEFSVRYVHFYLHAC